LSDIVYLNGAFLPRERATVSVDDRGFLFGDGVYEVIRVVGGAYIDAGRHLDRLHRGLAELGLPDHAAGGPDLLAIGAELLRRQPAGNEGEAVVYLQLTRGAAPRRHAFPAPGTPPTLFVSAWPFVPRREQMASGVAAITHPDLRWQRCDIKSVNLLPNVLANQRATEAGAYEAILVRDGVVTEGTHSNVVAVVDGELRTHPNGPAILPGVTREAVLELARDAGLAVREQALTLAELVRAEEVFFTGTTTDVMPAVSIDGRKVRDGVPGPIARLLGERLTARMESGAEARSSG
jgi:D-alanine transaminase